MILAYVRYSTTIVDRTSAVPGNQRPVNRGVRLVGVVKVQSYDQLYRLYMHKKPAFIRVPVLYVFASVV